MVAPFLLFLCFRWLSLELVFRRLIPCNLLWIDLYGSYRLKCEKIYNTGANYIDGNYLILNQLFMNTYAFKEVAINSQIRYGATNSDLNSNCDQ